MSTNNVQRQLPDNIKIADLSITDDTISNTTGNVTIDTTGNVVINATSNLVVKSNSSNELHFGYENLYGGQGGGEWKIVNTDTNSNIHLVTTDSNGAQNNVMVVDSYGSVGIGTSTPSQLLEINGLATAKNYAWKITSSMVPQNRSYSNGNIYFSSNTGDPYFNDVTAYNSAPGGAWNSTNGIFTVPETGVYNINLYLYSNGATGAGTWVQMLANIGGAARNQFLYGAEAGFTGARQISVTYTAYFEKDDYFSFKCNISLGTTITLYLQNGHTLLFVNKLT